MYHARSTQLFFFQALAPALYNLLTIQGCFFSVVLDFLTTAEEEKWSIHLSAVLGLQYSDLLCQKVSPFYHLALYSQLQSPFRSQCLSVYLCLFCYVWRCSRAKLSRFQSPLMRAVIVQASLVSRSQPFYFRLRPQAEKRRNLPFPRIFVNANGSPQKMYAESA